MIVRIAPALAVIALGCGGKSAPAPAPEEDPAPEEEVVTDAPPPDAAPEPPPPPPDPWIDDVAGDAFTPAPPAQWAAVMRPNAAWTFWDTSMEGSAVRITVESVTKEKIGHVVTFRYESRESWPPEEETGGLPEELEGEDAEEEVDPDPNGGWIGAPRRLAVSSKGVWWSDKPTGAFAKKPTFTPKVLKSFTQGTTLCLTDPVCEDECGELCIDSVAGAFSGHGGDWPGSGYFESTAARAVSGQGPDGEAEEAEDEE